MENWDLVFRAPGDGWADCALHTIRSHHPVSLNYALFLPLCVAKPKRLPAESSAGHHGDFYTVPPEKVCSHVCFNRSSVPLRFFQRICFFFVAP